MFLGRRRQGFGSRLVTPNFYLWGWRVYIILELWICGQNVHLSLIVIRAVHAIGVCFILWPRNRGRGERTELRFFFSGFGVVMGLRLYYILYMIDFTRYAAHMSGRDRLTRNALERVFIADYIHNDIPIQYVTLPLTLLWPNLLISEWNRRKIGENRQRRQSHRIAYNAVYILYNTYHNVLSIT